MKFSERFGLTPQKSIQLKGLDLDTRTGLWNVTCLYFGLKQFGHLADDEKLQHFARRLFFLFLKRPIDTIPYNVGDFSNLMKSLFFDAEWGSVFDVVEFLSTEVPEFKQENYVNSCNSILEQEKSAFRLLTGEIVPITNEAELQELSESHEHRGLFSVVSKHLAQATKLYSDRKQPDYRNSIKESISAVEATAIVVAGAPGATLGAALQMIEEKHALHPAFKGAINKLYGYTSDAGGIRHALSDSTLSVDEVDARYMLISCSAFVNYLISRSGVVR